MTRVLVLGASGMLGMMLVEVLARDGSVTLSATARDGTFLDRARSAFPEVRWLPLDATDGAFAGLEGQDWVINAIGLIKPYVHDGVMDEVEQAIRVNGLFPHRLAKATAFAGARLLQIATDCVYSGKAGKYCEEDPHDAEDAYGKSKSLGEVRGPHVVNIRCSIVGPEFRHHRSLLDWFRSQPTAAILNGFTNHRWNGVTTLQFAEIALGVVRSSARPPNLQHLIPGDEITKADLLRLFARVLDRCDIQVNDVLAPEKVDRTLATHDPDMNRSLWNAAGYSTAPTAAEMVARLATFEPRLLGRVNSRAL